MKSSEMLEFKNVEEIYKEVMNSIESGEFEIKNPNISLFFTDTLLPKGLTKAGAYKYSSGLLAPFVEFDETTSKIIDEKNLYEEADLDGLKINKESGEVKSRDKVIGNFMFSTPNPKIGAFRIYSIEGAKYVDDLLKLVRVKKLGL